MRRVGQHHHRTRVQPHHDLHDDKTDINRSREPEAVARHLTMGVPVVIVNGAHVATLSVAPVPAAIAAAKPARSSSACESRASASS